jgi:hypothetical protein
MREFYEPQIKMVFSRLLNSEKNQGEQGRKREQANNVNI